MNTGRLSRLAGLLLIATMACLSAVARPDEITLIDGTKYRGLVVASTDEVLLIQTEDGKESRKPALVLEIDEHSADAGVVTRLEAFHESLKSVELRLRKTHARQRIPAVQSPQSPWRTDWGDCSGRTLYIPWMGDCAYPMAAAFRHCGQDARIIPVADEESLRWGRKFTSGKMVFKNGSAQLSHQLIFIAIEFLYF